MLEATVPAPRSASGPRTNPGAGQTMHPDRPVRQKNEAQPTRAPSHPVTGRWPLAGSARQSCSHHAATDALAATRLPGPTSPSATPNLPPAWLSN